MKFDVSKAIIGYDGEPLKKSETDQMPVTLGETLSVACANANPQKHQSGDEKFKIYRILQKVGLKDATIVELSTEEIVTLKELVGESYGVPVVGPVFDALEKTDE